MYLAYRIFICRLSNLNSSTPSQGFKILDHIIKTEALKKYRILGYMHFKKGFDSNGCNRYFFQKVDIRTICETGQLLQHIRTICETGQLLQHIRTICETGQLPQHIRTICETGQLLQHIRTICETGQLPQHIRTMCETGQLLQHIRTICETGQLLQQITWGT